MPDFEVMYRIFDVREILNLRKIFKTKQRKTKVPSLTNLIKINLCSTKWILRSLHDLKHLLQTLLSISLSRLTIKR
jgi:hypothetical protein